MSEPAKQFDQAPESYSPKAKPEIMKLLEEAQQSVPAIAGAPTPFSKRFGVFQLPASRAIGMEERHKLHGGPELVAAPQWVRAFESELWRTVQALPQLISGSAFGWACDYDAESDTFSYLVSVLCPAGTAVPAGCQFRDVPPTHAAVGLWGDDLHRVIKRMKRRGYVTHYEDEGCEWNAELYFGEEKANLPRRPKANAAGCRWLVPCKPKKEKTS